MIYLYRLPSLFRGFTFLKNLQSRSQNTSYKIRDYFNRLGLVFSSDSRPLSILKQCIIIKFKISLVFLSQYLSYRNASWSWQICRLSWVILMHIKNNTKLIESKLFSLFAFFLSAVSLIRGPKKHFLKNQSFNFNLALFGLFYSRSCISR